MSSDKTVVVKIDILPAEVAKLVPTEYFTTKKKRRLSSMSKLEFDCKTSDMVSDLATVQSPTAYY